MSSISCYIGGSEFISQLLVQNGPATLEQIAIK